MASTPNGLADAKPAEQRSTVLDDLPFCLARASLSFRQFNDRTLRAVGLESQAPGTASVLHALGEFGDCTVSRLADKTHLPNGTLTGLLDALEGDQTIQRIPNPDDGRSWVIRLTKKGQKVCAKLLQRHELVMDVFRTEFSENDMAELKRLLNQASACMRKFRTALESTESPPAARRPRPLKKGAAPKL